MQVAMLGDRNKYIGGTDAAGVLAMSRWSSPMKVFAEKTGLIVTEDIGNKLYVKLGKKLEDIVAELFCDETGKKVRRVNETLFHPKYNFIGANIDRRIVGENAILECKTVSAWKSKEWGGEEIPREYIVQCLHYLAVTGADTAYIAVLIGNQDFKWKIIRRDEGILSDIVNREVTFWKDYVEKNEIPQVVTKYDAGPLDDMFPKENGVEIQLNDEANQIIEILDSYKQDRNNLDGLIDQKENELKLLLGEAKSGTTSLYKVNWSNSTYSSIDGKSLQIDMPDIWSKYYKTRPIRRFSYKKLTTEEEK